MEMSSKERREAIQFYHDALRNHKSKLVQNDRAKMSSADILTLDDEVNRVEVELDRVGAALDLARAEEGDELDRAMAALRHFGFRECL